MYKYNHLATDMVIIISSEKHHWMLKLLGKLEREIGCLGYSCNGCFL